MRWHGVTFPACRRRLYPGRGTALPISCSSYSKGVDSRESSDCSTRRREHFHLQRINKAVPPADRIPTTEQNRRSYPNQRTKIFSISQYNMTSHFARMASAIGTKHNHPTAGSGYTNSKSKTSSKRKRRQRRRQDAYLSLSQPTGYDDESSDDDEEEEDTEDFAREHPSQRSRIDRGRSNRQSSNTGGRKRRKQQPQPAATDDHRRSGTTTSSAKKMPPPQLTTRMQSKQQYHQPSAQYHRPSQQSQQQTMYQPNNNQASVLDQHQQCSQLTMSQFSSQTDTHQSHGSGSGNGSGSHGGGGGGNGTMGMYPSAYAPPGPSAGMPMVRLEIHFASLLLFVRTCTISYCNHLFALI